MSDLKELKALYVSLGGRPKIPVGSIFPNPIKRRARMIRILGEPGEMIS